MPDIYINVQDKIAQVSGKPVIVCGNSDYTVHFTFDSEWDEFTLKTVRIKYMVNGVEHFDETTCAGDICELPAVYNCDSVRIGVKAGNIHTTTGALIPCEECITDGGGSYQPPTPDVYEQLLTYITTVDYRLGGLSFARMTAEQYAALTSKDENTVYFVTGSRDFTIYIGELPLEKGSGTGGTPAPVQLAWSMPAVRVSRAVQMDISPSGAWKCDPEWYYEGTQTARIAGQGYTKTNAKPAIGFVSQVNYGGYYSTLMLISDDPDAVNNGVIGAANTSVQYGGITWYVTDYGYSQGGQWGDSTGHFQTYPETLAFDSATGTISAQAIADVLAYVHAVKNEEE